MCLSWADGFLEFDAELLLDKAFQAFQGPVWLAWNRPVFVPDRFFDQDDAVLLLVLSL